MNLGGRDAFPLNTKILAKREETEKLILNEHMKLKSLLVEKKNLHSKLTSVVESLQEESRSLTNQSSIFSGETSQLKYNIAQMQNSVQEILCKIDEITPKQMLANMVQDKEIRTLQIFYDRMENQKKALMVFWANGLDDSEIVALKEKKQKLIERQQALQNQINWFTEQCSESKINKLTEDCMILRKRNAALLKRKSRVAEQLERKILEKKDELASAKRNMTFKSS